MRKAKRAPRTCCWLWAVISCSIFACCCRPCDAWIFFPLSSPRFSPTNCQSRNKHSLWISSGAGDNNEEQRENDNDLDTPVSKALDQAVQKLTRHSVSQQFTTTNDSWSTTPTRYSSISDLTAVASTSLSSMSSTNPDSLRSIFPSFQKDPLEDSVERKYDNDSPSADTKGLGPPLPTQMGEMESENSDENNDELDSGLYIDTDVYMNYRSFMKEDGSLRFPQDDSRSSSQGLSQVMENFVDPPMSPNAVEGDDERQEETQNQKKRNLDETPQRDRLDKPTLADIIQAMQQTQTQDKQVQAIRAEQLHREVFQDEHAYLQQSEIFRQALTNRAAAREATALRRSANYRQRQEKDLQKLNDNLNEFEAALAQMAELSAKQKNGESLKAEDRRSGVMSPNNTTMIEPRICFKCKCRLRRDELEYQMGSYKRLCPSCYQELLDEDLSLLSEYGDDDNDDANDTEMDYEVDTNADNAVSMEKYRSTTPMVNSDEADNDISNEEDNDQGNWVLVDDPSTGEQVYWNEQTGEMSLEL
jgi:hypothetical protein